MIPTFSYQSCNATPRNDCLQSNVNTTTCSNTKSIELNKKRPPVSKDGKNNIHNWGKHNVNYNLTTSLKEKQFSIANNLP